MSCIINVDIIIVTYSIINCFYFSLIVHHIPQSRCQYGPGKVRFRTVTDICYHYWVSSRPILARISMPVGMSYVCVFLSFFFLKIVTYYAVLSLVNISIGIHPLIYVDIHIHIIYKYTNWQFCNIINIRKCARPLFTEALVFISIL